MRSWGQPPNQAVAHKRSENIGRRATTGDTHDANISSFLLSAALIHPLPSALPPPLSQSSFLHPSFFFTLLCSPCSPHRAQAQRLQRAPHRKMRGSRECSGFRCCTAPVYSYVCLCFRVCESLRVLGGRRSPG